MHQKVMQMNKQPYIGITGYKTKKELTSTAQDYARACDMELGNKHRLMMGLLCSSKRLANPSIEGTQSPAFSELPYLLNHARRLSFEMSQDPQERHCIPQQAFLPMIHYHPEAKEKLEEEVSRVFDTAGIYKQGLCRAVQLNCAWPEPTQLEALKNKFPDLVMVIQLPRAAIETLQPRQLAERAREYAAFADYFLVDGSGGFGIEFQHEKSIEILHALGEEVPGASLGIAGGLGNHNVYDRVKKLRIQLGNEFNIDAQNKLRREREMEKLSTIDCCNYLEEAVRAFAGK